MIKETIDAIFEAEPNNSEELLAAISKGAGPRADEFLNLSIADLLREAGKLRVLDLVELFKKKEALIYLAHQNSP